MRPALFFLLLRFLLFRSLFPSFLFVSFLILSFLLSSAAIAATSQPDHHNECVIVLHGINKSAFNMRNVEKALTAEGYVTWNESYPSRTAPVNTLALSHITQGLHYCREHHAEQIHFVTHSLGGLLLRSYLQDHQIEQLGHIVMLSPPNQGSELADHFIPLKAYRWLTGPAGQQLGTGANDLPKTLQTIDASIGIIAGRLSIEPWFSWMLPGSDDGKVSVDNMRLEEMNAFLEIKTTHGLIVHSRRAITAAIFYLQHGSFSAENAAG